MEGITETNLSIKLCFYFLNSGLMMHKDKTCGAKIVESFHYNSHTMQMKTGESVCTEL